MRKWFFTLIWNWQNRNERDNRAKRKRFERDWNRDVIRRTEDECYKSNRFN